MPTIIQYRRHPQTKDWDFRRQISYANKKIETLKKQATQTAATLSAVLLILDRLQEKETTRHEQIEKNNAKNQSK
jgi:hypothetical protein